MVGEFGRGVAGSARSGWLAVRGWGGWRTRRVWALLAVGVLVAGMVPVILVAGHRSAPGVVRLPRPVPIGAQPAPGVAPAAGPTDGATTGGPGPTAGKGGGPGRVRKQQAA